MLDPVKISDFKGLFYIRDILTLLPASLCVYAAILRSKKTPDSALLRALSGIAASASRRPRRSAVIIASCMFLLCSAIGIFIFRTRAHILDEAAYLFQSKIFASGRLWIKPPPVPDFFRLPYVAVTGGKWYGSFPPGQSVLLMAGFFVQTPFLINPILTATLTLLTVWAGTRLIDRKAGLLAGVLTLFSPFILFQGASYFSHIASAILFTFSAVGLFSAAPGERLKPFLSGFCVGMLLIFRPMSAAVLAAFIAVWLIDQILRKKIPFRNGVIRGLTSFTGAIPGTLLFLVYNKSITSNALLTPHQVVLPDERIGLGLHVLKNTGINFIGLSVDFLGVPVLCLIPILLCLLFTKLDWKKPFLFVFALTVIGYGLYPYHGLSYGPRFYFECMPLLLILFAKGIEELTERIARKPGLSDADARHRSASIVLGGLLICYLGVLPPRLKMFHDRGLYYTVHHDIKSRAQTPALVFLSDSHAQSRLFPYMAGFQQNETGLNGPIVYVRDLGERNSEIFSYFPDYHGYRFDLGTRMLSSLRQAPEEAASNGSGAPAEAGTKGRKNNAD